MSRSNRVGSRGGASSGLRAVANALGIARHEMSAYTKVSVSQIVLPLEKTDELQYMAELRQELLTRFHESSFHFDVEERDSEFRRYTDKYRETEKEELRPDWSRLPEELCWKKKTDEQVKKKRRITDKGADEVVEKLSKLEENEKLGCLEIETQETIDENDEESEKEEQNNENEQEALSDDDYQEEDNDYIHSYFDNGENYGDIGSDDNLDEDNAF
ncbi:Uncharacterized protein BM_BM6618 [Brugia malayi]|uniref:Bm6618 n=1 Tax=Brugia malayi TaxID=6279 RepID=A0A4E9FIC5_BRUMA|nr:Uncharacterized protein BM_BM6618 [Brugia malayi]VIO96695.1 Uncharacterized protein BM_BM6618 [Brugia malayi]